MKALNRKIKTPLFLHDLHGKEATVADLIFTYLAASMTTGLILYSAFDIYIDKGVFKFIILGLLAFDLSGGVIANFTQGTTNYYAESPKRRSVFIGLHLIQPMVMAWIFPGDSTSIYIAASYTLLATIVTSSLKEEGKQRVLAGALVTMGFSIVFLMSPESKVIHFMLILFIIKLILAFSVKWHNTTE